MQTSTDTSKSRNTSWWDAKSDEEKRAHIQKMLAGRQRARKAAKGNGQSTRNALADAFERIDAMEACRQEQAAEFKALNDAKRALSGDAWGPDADLVHAIRAVQSAILRGEVEVVAEDGRVAFYRVTRELVA